MTNNTHSPNIGLVTFGDGSKKWINARDRVIKEANSSKWFELAEGYNLSAIYQDMTLSDLEFVQNHPKGFGYWLFKPYSILHFLKVNPKIDFVTYLDAGSEIQCNNLSEKRWKEYIEITIANDYLAFQLQNIEAAWSKKDLVKLLNASESHIESGQIAGGHLIMSREFARFHCDNWLRVMRLDSHHYLDDSPSRNAEDDRFISHRHDQSISSLLLKSYGNLSVLSANEMEVDVTNPPQNLPFIAARNSSRRKIAGKSFVNSIKRKIKRSGFPL